MYTIKQRIRYSEMNTEGVLTISGLLNYFQDCCAFQSEDIGRGVAYLADHHRAWVLAGWNIEIQRMPRDMEWVEVSTWPYLFTGFYGYRNFLMKDAKGNVLAKANTCWIYMNMERMRPIRVPEEMTGSYEFEEPLDMERPARRMQLPQGTEVTQLPRIPVQPHHLDTNHHVNNGQYVSIASEYLPKDFQTGHIWVEYKKSALLGDVFYPRLASREKECWVSLDNAQGEPYAVIKFCGK